MGQSIFFPGFAIYDLSILIRGFPPMALTALCSREVRLSSRPRSITPRPMNEPFDRQLRDLISAILRLPVKTPEWRRQTNRFVRLVQQSGKLWRAPGVDREIYYDVLSNVWVYVLENFHKYKPELGAVMTWINNRLKWDIKTAQIKSWEELKRRLTDYGQADPDRPSWLDRLESGEDGGVRLEAMLLRWWEAKAQTQALHVQNRPDLNCYEFFQDMLGLSCEPDTWLERRDRPSYRTMAEYYKAPLPTIASFWTNKCLPLARTILRDLEFASGGLEDGT
jgi:hypothetical protein